MFILYRCLILQVSLYQKIQNVYIFPLKFSRRIWPFSVLLCPHTAVYILLLVAWPEIWFEGSERNDRTALPWGKQVEAHGRGENLSKIVLGKWLIYKIQRTLIFSWARFRRNISKNKWTFVVGRVPGSWWILKINLHPKIKIYSFVGLDPNF